MNELTIADCIDLHKHFCELYATDQLIGISTASVHITPETFNRWFKPEEIKESPYEGGVVKYVHVDGVKIIALFDTPKEKQS